MYSEKDTRDLVQKIAQDELRRVRDYYARGLTEAEVEQKLKSESVFIEHAQRPAIKVGNYHAQIQAQYYGWGGSKPNGMSYGHAARNFEYQQKRLLDWKLINSIGRYLTDEARELLTPRQNLMLSRGTAHIVHCIKCQSYFVMEHGRLKKHGGHQQVMCYPCRTNTEPSEKLKRLSVILKTVQQAVVAEQNKADGIIETDNE